MKRIPFAAAVLATALWVSIAPAWAVPFTAQVTDVADAGDTDNPFDFNASVGFRRVVKHTRITRESSTTSPQLADALDYGQVQQMLDMRASIGLWHDLELSFFLPYTLTQDSTWDNHAGITSTNSLVTNDPTLGGPLFDVPYKTYQRGLSSMDLGMAWSPISDQRDDTKPAVTLKFTYGIPIGAAYKPNANDPNDVANGRDQNNPAPLGDKVHRLKFEAGFSKRFTAVEPYFVLNYVQPIADKGAVTGLIPQNTGGFVGGFEIIPWDSPKDRQRLSLDIRVGAQYVGPGRTYSELSGPLRQLTGVDNYTNVSAGAHLVFQPIEYIRLTSGITFAYETAHFITNESPGTPGPNGIVDLSNPSQANPYYKPQIDGIGHRFKAEDTTVFSWYVALGFMI